MRRCSFDSVDRDEKRRKGALRSFLMERSFEKERVELQTNTDCWRLMIEECGGGGESFQRGTRGERVLTVCNQKRQPG